MTRARVLFVCTHEASDHLVTVYDDADERPFVPGVGHQIETRLSAWLRAQGAA